MMMNGTVTLNRLARDGVRAHAGSGSFRRRKRLRTILERADEQVPRLRRELERDPAAGENRRQAAQGRAARERQQQVIRALAELERIAAQYAARNAHDYERQKTPPNATGSPPQDQREPRVSTSDTAGGIVVGVAVINPGTDWDELPPMPDPLQRRQGRCPAQSLREGGFARFASLIAAESRGCEVGAPVPRPAIVSSGHSWCAARQKSEPLCLCLRLPTT